MTNGKTQDEPCYGFLTILEGPGGALLGGLLLVNRRGRPLEFHCTAPVAPSRAEEILFGPTLRPHFYCERIGAALLAKAGCRPQVLVVNQLDSWPLADETSTPVVLVDPRPADQQSPTHHTPGHAEAACLDRLDPAARPQVAQLLAELTRYVDLAEPFERIGEAIRETGLLSAATEDDPASDEDADDLAA